MKNKSKASTILKAFTEPIPKDEAFFKERDAICTPCEYNSDNIAKENLDVIQKVKISRLCSEGRMCTACGCCIDEKIGQKSQTCGLIEKQLEPKWFPIKAETASAKDLNIEILNNTAQKIDIDLKGQYFMINLGNVPEIVKEVKIKISKEGGLKITGIKAGCSCTVPVQKQIDENNVEMLIKLNTTTFTKNHRFEKSITVQYHVSSRGTKSTILKLIGHKL